MYGKQWGRLISTFHNDTFAFVPVSRRCHPLKHQKSRVTPSFYGIYSTIIIKKWSLQYCTPQNALSPGGWFACHPWPFNKQSVLYAGHFWKVREVIHPLLSPNFRHLLSSMRHLCENQGIRFGLAKSVVFKISKVHTSEWCYSLSAINKWLVSPWNNAMTLCRH